MHFVLSLNRHSKSAFTVVELVAVLTVIAVLGLLMVPALAGVEHKGGRVQCANNLRQIGAGSMAYASDYDDWLPPGRAGSNPTNLVSGMYYTRFAWTSPGNPGFKVPGSFTNLPADASFQNIGYLYPLNFLSDGQALFCPARYGGTLGSDYYQPLLTADSVGTVRSSYGYNPRVINPTVNDMRRYQKTSQLETHKLFGVDFIDQLEVFSHARERGWNVLFTDTSVNFSTSQRAYYTVKILMPQNPNAPYYNNFTDTLFNSLEADH